jgi:cation:H+ antiporter
VLLGALLPRTTAIGGVVSPASLFIVIMWFVGIYVINRLRKEPHWKVDMPGSHPGRRHRGEPHKEVEHPYHEHSARLVIAVFGAMCVVTLVAGVLLEVAGNELANRAGINGAIFGATVLAAVTALPEISSGIAAVKLGDNALAIGDIFGGNAFQVCLFLLADLIAGRPVLPDAGRLNSWLASLGIMLTAIYAIGIIGRPYRCLGRIGPDSVLACVLFGLGVAGMFLLPT